MPLCSICSPVHTSKNCSSSPLLIQDHSHVNWPDFSLTSWITYRANPPSRTIEPEQEKRRLFVALTQFFTGLASKLPVLLTVEDLHWSDETSLEFLHFLARRCAHHPLLLVLTYRNDEMHPGLSNWLAQLDRERLAHEFVL